MLVSQAPREKWIAQGETAKTKAESKDKAPLPEIKFIKIYTFENIIY